MRKRTRREIGGAALAAGGAGLALGVPGVARAELKVAGVRTARLDRKIAQAKAAMPKKPDASSRLYGGRYHPENQKTKILRGQETKRISGHIDELNRKRRAANKPKYYNNQTKLWGTALPVGGAASYVGAQEMVKKADKHDVNAAYAGGAAGFVGYQGGSLALKPFEKPAERKIKADPALHRILVEHRAKTLPQNAPAGHPGWSKYNRTYPKSLPGWRMKRLNARAVSGKSGGLATLGVTGAAAYGAVKTRQHHERKERSMRVSKEWSDSATGKQKAAYGAVLAPTLVATGVGGSMIGDRIGASAADHGWKQAAKIAVRSPRVRTGAALAATGMGAAGLAGHIGRKKGILITHKQAMASKVKKNDRVSAFGVEH